MLDDKDEFDHNLTVEFQRLVQRAPTKTLQDVVKMFSNGRRIPHGPSMAFVKEEIERRLRAQFPG